MRVGLTCQQLPWRLADALGAAAAREHAVVQEELQQAQGVEVVWRWADSSRYELSPDDAYTCLAGRFPR